MQNFIKKYWKFIILGLILVIFVLFVLSGNNSQETEEKPITVQQINNTSLPGKNIASNTQINISENIDLPEKATILTIQNSLPFTPEDANKIALSLGFNELPLIDTDIIRGEVYSWTQNNHSLSIVLNTREIRFNRNLLLSPATLIGEFPKQEDITRRLNTLFSEMGISIKLNQPQQVEYYLSDHEPVITAPKDADIQEVKYGFSYDGIEILNPTNGNSFATAWFDKESQIIRLVVQDSLSSLIKGPEIPLKNIQEVANSLIQEGKIHFVEGTYMLPEIESISRISIEQIELRYFYAEGKEIQPIYLLSGQGQSTDETWNIKLILPATKPEYVTKPQD